MSSRRNPILSVMGNIPARGRADVKTDFLIGKKAAEVGDRETVLDKARSLGRFAVKHIPFAIMAGAVTAVHVANIRNGDSVNATEVVQSAYGALYTSMQAGSIYAQSKLSGHLSKRAENIPDAEKDVDETVYETIERPGPSKLDKRFSDAMHGVMGLVAVSAVENLYNNY